MEIIQNLKSCKPKWLIIMMTIPWNSCNLYVKLILDNSFLDSLIIPKDMRTAILVEMTTSIIPLLECVLYRIDTH